MLGGTAVTLRPKATTPRASESIKSAPPPAQRAVPAATNAVPSGSPLILNLEVIVRLIYTHNPSVRAAREEMTAARHGLAEFRANLSRLEPFTEVRSDLSQFPNRRDAFGNSVETVVGVKKETFDGAVLSTEVGAAYSHFNFSPRLTGGSTVESGGGALVRTRLEKPFFGSRRRQDRIIAQAYQDSTARKAQLDYLKSYSAVVENALEYYNEAIYYDRLIDIYQRYAADLTALSRDPRLKPQDRARVESVESSAQATLNIYRTRWHEDREILRAYLALRPSQDFQIPVPEYHLSILARGTDQPDRLHQLLQKARENNPTFTVLQDARGNAELQRQRALQGRYDVTAFLEGTTFPVGSQTYDDRFQGWTVGGGFNVRLNDRRVLEATRQKAEAEIRQFEAQIEAEELLVRRRVTTETQSVLENDRNRGQILELVRQKAEEFRIRQGAYFANALNIDQLVDTRSGLANSESVLASNLYNSANRESRLYLATGSAYELVGLQVRSEPPAKGR